MNKSRSWCNGTESVLVYPSSDPDRSWEMYESSYTPCSYRQLVGQTELFNLGLITRIREDNSEFNPVVDLERDGLCQSILTQDILYE